MYLSATAYLLTPVPGWDLGSEALVSAFGNLSPLSQYAIKVGVAMSFTFHVFNGARHLVWDIGRGITNKQVARSGWAVVGASTVAAIILASWKPHEES